jgi:hypothetical protein
MFSAGLVFEEKFAGQLTFETAAGLGNATPQIPSQYQPLLTTIALDVPLRLSIASVRPPPKYGPAAEPYSIEGSKANFTSSLTVDTTTALGVPCPEVSAVH